MNYVTFLTLLFVLLVVAFFLPFDWWRKPLSAQRDTPVGRLLGRFLHLSPRNAVLRVVFLCINLALLLGMIFSLWLLAAAAVVGYGLYSAVRRVFRPSEHRDLPFIGFTAIILFGAVVTLGLLVPVRVFFVLGYFLLNRPAGGGWEMMTVGPEWVTADAVFCVAGIVGVCGWMALDAVWRHRQARQVENLPTSTVRSLAVGLVELKGTVRGAGSGHPVEATWSAFDYLKPQQRIEPFFLDDGTGQVLVDARGCRVRTTWITELAAVFGVREIVLTKHVERDEVLDETIRTLREGDRVYLVGTAEMRSDAPPDAVDAERLIIRPLRRSTWNETLWKTIFGAIRPPAGRDIHDVFFLTDGDEREARQHIRKGFRTVLLWGALWLIASIGLFGSAHLPERKTWHPESWRKAYWRGIEERRFLSFRFNREYRFGQYVKSLSPRSFHAIPALIEALDYEGPQYRLAAINALTAMMPETKKHAREIVPLLVKRLDDQAPEALYRAIIALGKFGPDASPAVPSLIARLTYDRETHTYKAGQADIRRVAVRALGEIGPSAREALPALREALNDSHPWVREEAEKAIRSIEIREGH